MYKKNIYTPKQKNDSLGQTHENRFTPLQNLIPKMHLFLVFVANNSKITNPNSLFCTETQLLNNSLTMNSLQ